MRILFLNQAPRDPQTTQAEITEIEDLLAGYASPGTQIV